MTPDSQARQGVFCGIAWLGVYRRITRLSFWCNLDDDLDGFHYLRWFKSFSTILTNGRRNLYNMSHKRVLINVVLERFKNLTCSNMLWILATGVRVLVTNLGDGALKIIFLIPNFIMGRQYNRWNQSYNCTNWTGDHETSRTKGKWIISMHKTFALSYNSKTIRMIIHTPFFTVTPTAH